MRSKTASLSIRPKTALDDDFLYALSDRVFSAYAFYPAHVTASMLRDPASHARVVELAGQRAGFFVLSTEALARSFGPWDRPVIARLDAIAVRPDLEGRGVGSFLLREAEALARRLGAVTMTLLTAETNTRARALFRAAGFLATVPIDRAYARGGNGIAMNKLLRRDERSAR